MQNLNPRNLEFIRGKDRYVYECLRDIVDGLNNVNQQTNANPNQLPAAPPNIGSISVLAANGIFDIQIQDGNQNISRGIHYFAEYSTTPNFAQPIVIHMGTSRNWRGYLGNLTLYFCGYSSYPTSNPSEPVFFGAPDAVVGGGSAGPTLQLSAGSGTAITTGLQPFHGFGKLPYRGPLPPRT